MKRRRCPQQREALIRAALLSFSVASCSQDTRLTGPGTDTTGGGGTIQRASLTIDLTIDAADSAIATALGLANRVLPGAEVSVRRRGSSSAPLTATSDAAGRAQFTDLLPGDYDVSAIRLVSQLERQGLRPEDQDVTALGTGRTIAVSAPATAAALTAVAGRRGSLVISELQTAIPRTPSGAYYFFGTYLELYNNSDTTIYLDGKVIVRGISWLRDYSSPRSCAEMVQWRADSAGIWASILYAIPGSGQTYPLLPGAAAVIATDAVDHSQFVTSLPNLTSAPFESIGSSDVDNPSAANLINVGLRPWAEGPERSHGLDFGGNHLVIAVTEPLDVAALPRDDLPVVNPEHVLVPHDRILDVFASGLIPPEEALPFLPPLCPELVSAVFDRQHANLMSGENPYGIRRTPLFTLPSGRVVLQRTKTSARDFEIRSPATPGIVP